LLAEAEQWYEHLSCQGIAGRHILKQLIAAVRFAPEPREQPNPAVQEILDKFNRHFFTQGLSWGRIGKNEYRALALAINPPPAAYSAPEPAAKSDVEKIADAIGDLAIELKLGDEDLEADYRDAERYRFLRTALFCDYAWWKKLSSRPNDEAEFDAMVDAASSALTKEAKQ